ncbi:MAG: diacylglycerol kinase family protein [Planctomycetota bacterium]|nr:diacylglycerol kinase family protein [Planctomycetota bacterium]
MGGLKVRSPSPTADLVVISMNPSAGARSGRGQVERLQSLLHEDGYRVRRTSDLEELRQITATAMAAGNLRVVVAAGGDGTIARVLNETEPGIPLTILPLGTENLLSKYLSIDPGPESVASLVRDGWTVDLDAGRANGTLFTLMLGCGFDAEVVRRLDSARRGHIRHLSYLRPILDTVRHYDYPEIRVSLCGQGNEKTVTPLTARWVFVVNLPRYACNLKLVPGATGTDGLLDLCTFRRGSILQGLRYLAGVLRGKHQEMEDCVMHQAPYVRLESDQPVPYQLDGDPGGELPVEVEVVPGRLKMMVPAAWVESRDPG